MPANDPQTGPQMISGWELIPPQKVRNEVDSIKVYRWRYIYLIIAGVEKTSTSGTKAAIKHVKYITQNTKLTCVDCLRNAPQKRTRIFEDAFAI